MRQDFIDALKRSIPPVRLRRYEDPSGRPIEQIANYFWNIALSESLYPCLHAAELALRNTLDQTFTTHHHQREWWEAPRSLKTYQRNTIIDAQAKYLKETKIPIPPDLLIATLTFGFYTALLSSDYEPFIWGNRKANRLQQAFPNAVGLDRATIHDRFHRIRILRNRVMHHEAIFDRPNLVQEHRHIHEAIDWINPQLHQAIHSVDSFGEIYTDGRDRILTKLQKFT